MAHYYYSEVSRLLCSAHRRLAGLRPTSIIVRMLQYSLTISLGFPTLFGMTIAALIGLTFVIRYRYLARYTQLKEPALPPPSPPSRTAELLPLTTPGLGDRRNRSAAFHNYLDDFLAAIRIFGYLEKPVFHELSRHLQTRRLAAGDSIEIGGGEFWCVVEGKVQVVSLEAVAEGSTKRPADSPLQFAPSDDDPSAGPPPDAFEASDSFNGYHLLNEVSTGGTLSSLFSILQLFTEDIKLSWTPPPESSGSEEMDLVSNDIDTSTASDHASSNEPIASYRHDQESDQLQMRRKLRQNSDVSQLASDQLGERLSGPVSSPRRERPVRHARSMSTGMSTTSEDTATSPPQAGVSDTSTSVPGTKSPSPSLPATLISPNSQPARSQLGSRPHSAVGRKEPTRRGRKDSRYDKEATPSSVPRSDRTSRNGGTAATGAALMHGTIARATVDTTLAVIPAEAFKKLTRKFPKAAGTVVQVVLERFSRVTFMTGKCTSSSFFVNISAADASISTQVSWPDQGDSAFRVIAQLPDFTSPASRVLHWDRDASPEIAI